MRMLRAAFSIFAISILVQEIQYFSYYENHLGILIDSVFPSLVSVATFKQLLKIINPSIQKNQSFVKFY